MLAEVSVSYVSVLAAAVAAYVFGFVWHMVLGKQWARLSGISPAKAREMMKKAGARGYVGQFVLTVVMSFVLAWTLALVQAETVVEATMGAFWIWLGFVATVLLSDLVWKGGNLGMFAINGGFYLISLVIMANVILLVA